MALTLVKVFSSPSEIDKGCAHFGRFSPHNHALSPTYGLGSSKAKFFVNVKIYFNCVFHKRQTGSIFKRIFNFVVFPVPHTMSIIDPKGTERGREGERESRRWEEEGPWSCKIYLMVEKGPRISKPFNYFFCLLVLPLQRCWNARG